MTNAGPVHCLQTTVHRRKPRNPQVSPRRRPSKTESIDGSIDTQSLKTSLSGCYDAALLTPVCDVDSIDQFKKVVERKPSALGRKRLARDAQPLTFSQRTLPLRKN